MAVIKKKLTKAEASKALAVATSIPCKSSKSFAVRRGFTFTPKDMLDAVLSCEQVDGLIFITCKADMQQFGIAIDRKQAKALADRLNQL